MKIRKKLLGYLAVIGLGLCAFAPSSLIGNAAQAATVDGQTTTTQNQEKSATIEESLNELWTLVDIGLKLMYIVIWPILFLAGIALDNSMVYGSFFHMDAPLWFFWNMTKNFANFALGFIVLFAILKGIFSSFGDKGKDARNPMEIIKKTLIAGVLIQASWFLLAAVVDVSTVATYAIGGMPMSLLNDKNVEGNNKKILQTESHLELNNVTKLQEEDFRVWYKTKVEEDIYMDISPCLTKTLGTSTYIVGRKYGDAKFNGKEISQKIKSEDLKVYDEAKFPIRNVCIFGDTPYFFNEFPNTLLAQTNSDYQYSLNSNLNAIGNYTDELSNCRFIINLDKENSGEEPKNCGEIINTLRSKLNEKTKELIKNNDDLRWLDASNDEAIQADGYLKKITPDVFYKDYSSTKGNSRLSTTLAPTVAQIIDKSQGFVGPFVTIYASIMDFANLSDSNSNNSSIGKNLGNMLIRTAVAIGMVFPLIALAVVLFIRIGFLRAVIAASPILILANVFKDTIKIDLGDHFTTENILKAIFAPVITVFALSISMIFMTTISNSLSTHNIDKINIMEQLGFKMEDGAKKADPGNTYLEVAGFTIVYPKVVDTYAGATGDWFSWILVSFCGIGIMRFILFAAIKASGTIGTVGKSIQKFGENVLKTSPIIPIPGGGRAGIGTIKESLNVNTANKMRENKVGYSDQQKNMKEYFESKFATSKDNYGEDRNFTSNEKVIVNSALESNNADKVIQTLADQGFIKREETLKDTYGNVEKLYNESPEFKKMVANNINTGTNTTAISTILSNEFLGEKLKESIDVSLSGNFKDKEELQKKLEEINKSDEKVLGKITKFEKEITTANKTKLTVIKGSDGKLNIK